MEELGLVTLDGTSNTRDIGAHSTTDGRRLIRRRLFRSANLDQLTAADCQRLRALGVVSVIDLRGVKEAAAAPVLEGVARLHLPIEPTVTAALEDLHQAGRLDAATAVGVMQEAYRRFVCDHTTVYAALLHHVLDQAGKPVLFHCTAGKDRTGVAAALILSALRVDRAAIAADYLISNQLYRPKMIPDSDIDPAIRDCVVKVRPAFLAAAFAAMEDGWGSVDAYLDRALHFGAPERTALADALL